MTSTPRLAPDRPVAERLRRAARPVTEDFRTPVRGFVFAAPPPGTDVPQPGDPARLVREPGNPRDPLAVAIWTADGVPWRIGYLDRAVAARLAPRLDAGQRFLTELAGWVEAPGAVWHRPLLRIATPPQPDPPAAGTRAAGPGVWGRPPGSRRRTLPDGR
jgi:hypothetical protein